MDHAGGKNLKEYALTCNLPVPRDLSNMIESASLRVVVKGNSHGDQAK